MDGDFQVWGWSSKMLKVANYEEQMATAALLRDTPLLLEEVQRLRAWKKLVSDIVQQQDGSHLREMLKELIE